MIQIVNIDTLASVVKKFASIYTRHNFFTALVVVLLIFTNMIINTNSYSANGQMLANNHSGVTNLNVSLSQAIIIAQESIGSNSSAIAAFAQNVDGSPVYSIILTIPTTDYYDIIIDANKGHLLSTEKLSKNELEKRHLEHSQRVMSEPHLRNNTFVH